MKILTSRIVTGCTYSCTSISAAFASSPDSSAAAILARRFCALGVTSLLSVFNAFGSHDGTLPSSICAAADSTAISTPLCSSSAGTPVWLERVP